MTCHKLFIIKISLSIICVIPICAQQSNFPKNSSEWLVDMFFNQHLFPEKENYYSGEMLQDVNYPTIGEELNGNSSVSSRKISANSQSEVYSIIVKYNEHSSSFYCYLLKVSGNWKIDAIRKFQLPNFIYDVADSIARIETKQDSVSNLQTMIKLITSSDEELKLYLSRNINSFSSLIDEFEGGKAKRLASFMNKCGVESIFNDDLYPECIFILIGKLDRFEVGYIYSLKKSSLPSITPQRFIYIEEVLPKWFVYRAM